MSFVERKTFSKCNKTEVVSDTLIFNNLLENEWIYSSSFNNDNSVIVLNKLGDLPLKIGYYKSKETINVSKKNPIYLMWKKNEIKNIYSLHDEKPFGNRTYPILLNRITKNGSEKLKIQHYIIDKNKFGKGYAYSICKIKNDTLILENERLYDVKGVKSLLRHVYIKKVIFRTKN